MFKNIIKKFNKLVNKQRFEINLLKLKYSEKIVKKIVNLLHNTNYYLIEYDNYTEQLNKIDIFKNKLNNTYKHKLNNSIFKKLILN